MSHAHAKLSQLINQAPREIQPQKELWQDIEKQLDKAEVQQSQQPKRIKHVAVASIALAVGLVASNIWQQEADILTPNEPSALLTTLADIKDQHQQQVDLLSRQQLTNWQASTLASPLEKGIEQLRKAAEQIYQALRQTPNDKELWQLWLWTQQREIELLQQGQKLPVTTLPQGA